MLNTLVGTIVYMDSGVRPCMSLSPKVKSIWVQLYRDGQLTELERQSGPIEVGLNYYNL